MPTIKTNEIFANRYKLIKQLGIGGYSEVWLAEDQYAGNMKVAVKIYAPGKGLDEDGLKTFGKEYTYVFNLNNAHLLKPMHYDVCEGSPYLVLQYCKNGSLYKKIGTFTENQIADFILQACEAIAYLHKKEPPIIHQDIKPDNFLIDEDGNYLLADFGISSKIRRTLTRSIGEKASTGTMAYMPPEKFNEDRQAIKAGDIFSLGVCMFELLTGELAFGDLGGLALKSGADLPKLPNSFSKELNSIIRSCLAKDPWNRPTAEILMEIADNYKHTTKWNLDKLPIAKEQVAEKQPEITKEPKIWETAQKPVNDTENKKELPIIESKLNKTTIILWIIIFVSVLSFFLFFKNKSEIEKTPIFGSFTDTRDGQVYKTVKIGNQTWMAENLKYRANNELLADNNDEKLWANNNKYNGWSDEKKIRVSDSISHLGIFRQTFDGEVIVKDSLGRDDYNNVFYQWNAAINACPKGWHLPTVEDWKELENYLGGGSKAIAKLRTIGNWDFSKIKANNNSGFSAKPNIVRGKNGLLYDSFTSCEWWVAKAINEYLAYSCCLWSDDSLEVHHISEKGNGTCVRCIKNE